MTQAPLKLKATRLQWLAVHSANLASIIKQLSDSEQLAPVNVHSHGPLIENLCESTSRLHLLAREYQLEVQGR